MSGLAVNGELSSAGIVPGLERDIQERAAQYAEVTGQRPELSIVSAHPDHLPSLDYMGMKQTVGERLGVRVNTYSVGYLAELEDRIQTDNEDPDINGIIVQLPLRPELFDFTPIVLDSVNSSKDVDGLGPDSPFVPATVRAIDFWAKGHGVDLENEHVVLVGLGLLVNGPYFKLLKQRGVDVRGVDLATDAYTRVDEINKAGVIVSAVGHPNLLTPDLFETNTGHKVLIDVGTAEQGGAVQGDVSDELRDYAVENGWAINSRRGSIGPLTVRSLLVNVMDAAEAQLKSGKAATLTGLPRSLADTSASRPPGVRFTEDDRQVGFA